MRNFIWSFLVFFCFMSGSFCQTKSIEKGTYLSTNSGQKIKLNLLEDNKYELILYSGDYTIKGDSLLFSQNKLAEEGFELTFVKDKKAKKIKINFVDPSFYPFYIGTQKGDAEVQYQKLYDIKAKIDPEWKDADVAFDIDKCDFLYLVVEGYQTKTKLYKYALPKDVAEITVKYSPDLESDLKITGFLDRKTNQFRISDKGGKNPLVFVNEKDNKPDNEVKVTAIESQNISNWTYPGKEPLADENFDTDVASADTIVADTTAVAYSYEAPKVDFKLKIESNLKEAVAATKNSKTKFLVVYADSKNPSAKANFDQFVKDQETEVANTMYDSYNAELDVFNYYLATAEDKKWLKNNKLSTNPAVIILNGDGDVLASSESTLEDQKYKFNTYSDFYKQVQGKDAFFTFNKVAKNKKAKVDDLILAFNKASILSDNVSGYETEETEEGFKFVKATLDKKEVLQLWKKVIEARQKDTKPNLFLVEAILKEINNQGFYKLFFKEDKLLDSTDFLSIDYLIKHYDAIEATKGQVGEGYSSPVNISLMDQISGALYTNGYGLGGEGVDKANKNQIIKTFRKLIALGTYSFYCYKSYFAILEEDPAYVKEFSGFFNSYLALEKGNPFERLDELYKTFDNSSEFSFEGWNSLKEYYSGLCNSAAWKVVLNPENTDFVKPAINWSEYSLIVTKNNPYYLDTLAQLYYKDGQKEKAIETQKKALQYSVTIQEEGTVNDMKTVLEKMENGTY
ncbi:hypothetical protein [Flavobacterium poyangense]|uniref:hypothetical protein n=1 Tax=Flavobacterium poyangense TaxID=2204302 RepID=UPI00142066E0|nr:hypothetical protein [Flavobacterium sp. JXAS1]